MADKTRILMLTMKMDIGGAETHILEAAKELTRRGFDVTVASNGGVFVPELEAAGVRHLSVPFHSKSPASVLSARRRIRRLLRDEHFDVVHAHARIPAAICGRLVRRAGVPFVTTAHLTFSVNALWRRLCDWGEQTLAVSDDIKAYLTAEYGVPPEQIVVTVNGIDTATYSSDTDPSDILAELGLKTGPRRVVLVSRIDADRSLAALRLAEAAPEICAAHPDTELLIVGGGNDFDRLRAAADAANTAIGREAVRLTGARTDINRLIAAGEIFVGVSRAALEAMAMSRPTVLAGNEGYLGVFRTEKFATAYDSNFCCRGCGETTAMKLAQDVCDLLSRVPDELAAIGQEGRDVVEQHYSVTRMADDYCEIYRRVLKQ